MGAEGKVGEEAEEVFGRRIEDQARRLINGIGVGRGEGDRWMDVV